MTKILVDFNDLARGGQVRVSSRRAPEDLRKGQHVLAYDPEAEMECEAIVADLTERTIYLLPLWDMPDGEVTTPVTLGSVFRWDGQLTEIKLDNYNRVGGSTWGPRVPTRTVAPSRVVAPA